MRERVEVRVRSLVRLLPLLGLGGSCGARLLQPLAWQRLLGRPRHQREPRLPLGVLVCGPYVARFRLFGMARPTSRCQYMCALSRFREGRGGLVPSVQASARWRLRLRGSEGELLPLVC